MLEWFKALSKDNKWLVGSMAAAWVAQLLYFVSPIDLVPDFIPFVGWIDDLFALVSVISFTIYGYRRLRKNNGFAGLGPERPATRDLPTPVEVVPEPDISNGDTLNIEGYRPLSYDDLKAL